MEQRYQISADDLVERLLLAVRRVMSVREVTAGGAQQGFVARFRGRFLIDSEQAYDSLEPIFSKEEVLLVTRSEGDEHVVLAMPGLMQPKASNPWINVLLFILTLLSMLMAGVLYGYEGPTEVSLGQFFLDMLKRLPRGVPFAASLLAILLAHEFGHYLAARYHKTAVTLPYFLPFPGSPFGTLGAFIQLRQPPRNRKVLLDIGLAGPLAGFIVVIPILLYGLSLSEVGTLPTSPLEAMGQGLEGNSILYLGAKYLIKGELLPAPLDYASMNPVLYWLRYLVIGLPIPYGGRDVMLHDVAWAGWAGLLVTALNLIPAGQLDGGHVVYVLLGRRAARLWPAIVVALVLLGMVWPGWYLWAGLIFFLGRTHAQPLDEITSLDGRRKALAVFGLVLFVLVFMPVPLRGF